jgi:DDE superfamily endonuclease
MLDTNPLKEVIYMRTLPTAMVRVLAPFVPLFSERVWQHAQVLLAGPILAPGRRTVAAALRVMGLGQSKQFHRYHRAKCSGREAARVLSGLLARTFVPDGEPLVIGVDETLERRWGKKIAAKGTYRDIRCAPATSISSRPAPCGGCA